MVIFYTLTLQILREGQEINLFFLALHKESTQSCSNVAMGYNVCLTLGTAVRILALWLLFYSDIINGELLTWCLKLTTQIVSFWTLSTAALCMLVLLALPGHAHAHLRCCRCCLLCAWLENRFDHRDPRLLSHLVGGEDLIYGDKIPISWSESVKCQSCLLWSKSEPWLSVIGLWLFIKQTFMLSVLWKRYGDNLSLFFIARLYKGPCLYSCLMDCIRMIAVSFSVSGRSQKKTT